MAETEAWRVLNTHVKDRKDRKNFADPVTALEWATLLKDFPQRARWEAANLAAHNWDVTLIGDRLLFHCFWSEGVWWTKDGVRTKMTKAEQSTLYVGKEDKYGNPPPPRLEALTLQSAA